LARETLHVMDDKRRIAIVETKTVDSSAPSTSLPAVTMRFQFENHLGTSCLELSETAAVLSYEEYYPYGSTSYQAGRTLAEVSLKRYRYTAKERDEESGLYYYGARYYVPWLGRWTAPDPSGLIDGTNLYAFVKGNPIISVDAAGKQAGPYQGYVAARQMEQAVGDLANDVGAPGFWEGMIPVWGSGREAIHDFQTGHWGWGIVNTGLAVSDVFLVKSLVTAGGKLVVKGGARLLVREGAELTTEAAAKEMAAKELAAKELAAREAREAAAREAAREAAAKEAAAREAAKETAAKEAATRETAAKEAAGRQSAAKPSGGAGRAAAGTSAAGHAALSPAQIVTAMERHVAKQNAMVANAIRNGNRAFFRRLGMSEKQIRVLMNPKARSFAAQYGNAMERAVARAFRSDPTLRGLILDARNMSGRIFPKLPFGRALRPDFGLISGELQGLIVDLTTAGGRATKMAKYLDKVLVLEYVRPTF
jgi:RHS repeat-associated protein